MRYVSILTLFQFRFNLIILFNKKLCCPTFSTILHINSIIQIRYGLNKHLTRFFLYSCPGCSSIINSCYVSSGLLFLISIFIFQSHIITRSNTIHKVLKDCTFILKKRKQCLHLCTSRASSLSFLHLFSQSYLTLVEFLKGFVYF